MKDFVNREEKMRRLTPYRGWLADAIWGGAIAVLLYFLAIGVMAL